MAKTTAPLLGFGASGQIGKTQVYATWRGVSYARRHVVPANPKTTAQTNTRSVFNWLNQVWKLMDPAVQAVWTAFAKGKPLTDRNAWIKSNLASLRGTTLAPATDIDGLIGSPGVNGGLATGGTVLSDGGTHHVTVTMTAPTLPSGWAIVKAHAMAIKQQAADTDAFYSSYYASDNSAPYAPSIALGAAMTAEVVSFFEYTKPDGSTAFGPSDSGQVVVA